jgi:membrane associated rhomboid family serine protease
MIPLRDVIPSRRPPYLTIALVLTGLAAFLIVRTSPPLAGGGFDRALRSVVGHQGWVQTAIDLLFLWIFGENVEDRLGRVRFVGLCLAGTAAAAGAGLAAPHPPPPVAVGVLGGILGAYLVLFPRSRVLVLVPLPVVFDLVEIPALHLIGAWYAAQAVITLVGGDAALLTALAGTLAGLATVWLVDGPRRRDLYWRSRG